MFLTTSEKNLLQGFSESLQQEREALVHNLDLLLQLDDQKLALKLGYSSTFDYLVNHHGLSESAATRRIYTARTVRDFPQLRAHLQAGRTNMTNICLFRKILKHDQLDQQLETLLNKSTRACELAVQKIAMAQILKKSNLASSKDVHQNAQALLEEMTKTRDKIRPLLRLTLKDPAQIDANLQESGGSEKPSSLALEMTKADQDPEGGSSQAANESNSSNSQIRAQETQSESLITSTCNFLLTFEASAPFKAKLDRARSLLSSSQPGNNNLEQIFDKALDALLERMDPQRREQRRKRRDELKRQQEEARCVKQDPAVGCPAATDPGPSSAGNLPIESQSDAPKRVESPEGRQPAPAATKLSPQPKAVDRSRKRRRPAMASRLRDRIWMRDGGRCTFAGLDGRRCDSTHDLEVDHILPVALGGRDDESNLRLLCRHHNAYERGRVLGPFVNAKPGW